MPGEIHTLQVREDRLFKGDLPVFRQLLLPLMEDPSTPPRIASGVVDVLAYLDRHAIAFSRKGFVMLFPSQQLAVAKMLRGSSRPAVANVLWALCFENMTREGEVSFDRARFAAELGVGPRVVSRLMGELVAFKALLRQGTPRRFRYFVNPHVGTRQGLTEALAKQQAAAPSLALVGGCELASERRSRAPCVVPLVL